MSLVLRPWCFVRSWSVVLRPCTLILTNSVPPHEGRETKGGLRTKHQAPRIAGSCRSGKRSFQTDLVAHRNPGKPHRRLMGVLHDVLGNELSQMIAAALVEIERRQ